MTRNVMHSSNGGVGSCHVERSETSGGTLFRPRERPRSAYGSFALLRTTARLAQSGGQSGKVKFEVCQLHTQQQKAARPSYLALRTPLRFNAYANDHTDEAYILERLYRVIT
jgi:hypothetical protein